MITIVPLFCSLNPCPLVCFTAASSPGPAAPEFVCFFTRFHLALTCPLLTILVSVTVLTPRVCGVAQQASKACSLSFTLLLTATGQVAVRSTPGAPYGILKVFYVVRALRGLRSGWNQDPRIQRFNNTRKYVIATI